MRMKHQPPEILASHVASALFFDGMWIFSSFRCDKNVHSTLRTNSQSICPRKSKNGLLPTEISGSIGRRPFGFVKCYSIYHIARVYQRSQQAQIHQGFPKFSGTCHAKPAVLRFRGCYFFRRINATLSTCVDCCMEHIMPQHLHKNLQTHRFADRCLSAGQPATLSECCQCPFWHR